MGNLVLERRKFARVDVKLEIWLNNEIKGVMKTLSLGGCSIETESPVHIKNSVCIKIFSEGKSFEVGGDVLYSQKEKSYCIRFYYTTKEQNLWLIKVIENMHKTSAPLRPTRVSLQGNAVLDRKPALITDISEVGCFIQTSESFNSNDIVDVEFRIKEEKMSLVGQVLRAEPKGIEIEFLSPSPTQISTISRYVSLKLSSSRQASSSRGS